MYNMRMWENQVWLIREGCHLKGGMEEQNRASPPHTDQSRTKARMLAKSTPMMALLPIVLVEGRDEG